MQIVTDPAHANGAVPLLGRTADGPIEAHQIEQWGVDRNLADVTFISEEFQALCPVTKQPDVYSLRISYASGRTFESKGLKHYLWGFRDRPLSAENLATTLADELTRALGSPVAVALVQNVRGGLQLHVEALGRRDVA